MKESGFIRQNIKKWVDFEEELANKSKDPYKTGRLYTEITNDLSYAGTFYKNRLVRLYLNGLGRILFNKIYRQERFKFRFLVDFWKLDLPIVLYQSRKDLLISFLVFCISMAIGIISSRHDPAFAQSILGEDYINMTLENIEKGDPMAVYKQSKETTMFLGITLNNLYVSFKTFVFGIFVGIGTLISLIINGVMVGTFQYFFIERDLFQESFLTIWQHGTLEISSIILAGAAGLTMSRGLLFPGTLTRFQALKFSAQRGLKIMLGITPVFIFAAFIEGFFTRYTEAPDMIRVAVILFSLAFIIGYFIVYPQQIAKNNPEKTFIPDYPLSSMHLKKSYEPELMNHMDFYNSLRSIGIYFGNIFRYTIFISLLASFLISIFSSSLLVEEQQDLIGYGSFYPLFDYKHNILLYILNSSLMSVLILMISRPITKSNSRTISALILSFSCQSVLFFGKFMGIISFVLILPLFLVVYTYALRNNKGFLNSIKPSLEMLQGIKGKLTSLYFGFLILSALVQVLITPRLYWSFINSINWILYLNENASVAVFNFIISFIFYFAQGLCISCISLAIISFYDIAHEIKFASALINRIKKIGSQRIIKGYEFES